MEGKGIRATRCVVTRYNEGRDVQTGRLVLLLEAFTGGLSHVWGLISTHTHPTQRKAPIVCLQQARTLFV